MARRKNPVRRPGSPATGFLSNRDKLIARTLERWLDDIDLGYGHNISLENVIASRFDLKNGMKGLRLYVPPNKKLKDNTLTGIIAWSYVDEEDGYEGKPFIQYAYELDFGEKGYGRVEGVGSTAGRDGSPLTALEDMLYIPLIDLMDNYYNSFADEWEQALDWAADPNNPINQPKKKNPVASSLGSIALAGLAGYLIGKK